MQLVYKLFHRCRRGPFGDCHLLGAAVVHYHGCPCRSSNVFGVAVACFRLDRPLRLVQKMPLIGGCEGCMWTFVRAVTMSQLMAHEEEEDDAGRFLRDSAPLWFRQTNLQPGSDGVVAARRRRSPSAAQWKETRALATSPATSTLNNLFLTVFVSKAHEVQSSFKDSKLVSCLGLRSHWTITQRSLFVVPGAQCTR